MYIYIYVCVYLRFFLKNTCVYIYMYMRFFLLKKNVCVYIYVCACVIIYTYIYKKIPNQHQSTYETGLKYP
jgi:hypothetical protein